MIRLSTLPAPRRRGGSGQLQLGGGVHAQKCTVAAAATLQALRCEGTEDVLLLVSQQMDCGQAAAAETALQQLLRCCLAPASLPNAHGQPCARYHFAPF